MSLYGLSLSLVPSLCLSCTHIVTDAARAAPRVQPHLLLDLAVADGLARGHVRLGLHGRPHRLVNRSVSRFVSDILLGLFWVCVLLHGRHDS